MEWKRIRKGYYEARPETGMVLTIENIQLSWERRAAWVWEMSVGGQKVEQSNNDYAALRHAKYGAERVYRLRREAVA